MSQGPEQNTEELDPNLLRTDVLCGLAFDVYYQFRDLSGDPYWLTPSAEVQVGDEEKQLALGEPRTGNVYGPINIYSVGEKGEPLETMYAFPYRGHHILDEHGETLEEGSDELQHVRQCLVSLRDTLLRKTLEPLEQFAAKEKAEVNVIIHGGPATYEGIDFKKRYPTGLTLSSIIDCAIEEFKGLNGRRPEYGASITLVDGGVDEEIPEGVWRPYYSAIARAGSLKRAAL